MSPSFATGDKFGVCVPLGGGGIVASLLPHSYCLTLHVVSPLTFINISNHDTYVCVPEVYEGLWVGRFAAFSSTGVVAMRLAVIPRRDVTAVFF